MAGVPSLVLAWPTPFGLRAGAVWAGAGALAAGAGCDGTEGVASCAGVWLRVAGLARLALRTAAAFAVGRIFRIVACAEAEVLASCAGV